MLRSLPRTLFLPLAALALVSCDDATGPAAGEGTVTVQAYVDADGSGSFDGGDLALDGATVTLASEGETVAEETTDAEGRAVFEGLAPGSYTVSLSGDVPEGATLATASQPVVAVPFQGGEVQAEFRFVFFPGDLTGTVFRDENDSGEFEEDEDTPAAGIDVDLFAGTDVSGDPVATTTTDESGSFTFEGVRPGTYTLRFTPFGTIEIVGGNTRTVEVEADATATLEVEFTGEPTIDVAEARDQPEGTTVTVEGVVSVDVGAFGSSSYYVQDETAGIAVFHSGAPSFEIGDVVRVTGPIGFFNDETQISGADAAELLGSGPPPEPVLHTGADLNAGDDQGEVIRIEQLTVVDVETFSFDNHNVTALDPSGEIVEIRVDSRTGIGSDDWTVGETYDVTGIASRFFDTFQLKPRQPSDQEESPATLSVADARSAAEGTEVRVQGVVSVDVGAFGSSAYYLQDGSGGIALFHSGAPGFEIGDTVFVSGERSSFNDEVQIAVETALLVASGPGPDAVTRTGAELNAGDDQGEVILVGGLTVDEVEVFTFDNHNVTATDPDGETVVIRVDSRTGIGSDAWTVGETYDVTGIASRFFDTFQLKPRQPSDVVLQ